MVLRVLLVIVALVIVVGWLVFSGTLYRLTVSPEEQAKGLAIHAHMRGLALSMTRDSLGIAAPASANQPWGVVMDWGLGEVTTTVVAYATGDASMYLSSGGGFIGGRDEPTVHAAALALIDTLAHAGAPCDVRTQFPLPAKDHVTFHLLTDGGVRVCQATNAELMSGKHPLSNAYDVVQELIAAFRNSPTIRSMVPQGG